MTDMIASTPNSSDPPPSAERGYPFPAWFSKAEVADAHALVDELVSALGVVRVLIDEVPPSDQTEPRNWVRDKRFAPLQAALSHVGSTLRACRRHETQACRAFPAAGWSVLDGAVTAPNAHLGAIALARYSRPVGADSIEVWLEGADPDDLPDYHHWGDSWRPERDLPNFMSFDQGLIDDLRRALADELASIDSGEGPPVDAIAVRAALAAKPALRRILSVHPVGTEATALELYKKQGGKKRSESGSFRGHLKKLVDLGVYEKVPQAYWRRWSSAAFDADLR